ncbi:GntR family transcriptional regulator [Pseudooceanicola nanhaiensis]|uniref:GntR family transcriptional regulator n=1 Tax=Pseudooceanicola nanhaiensis TaxID=375761 RepID=UPI001CD5D340|nr:GntR family transcriptional regulator [Pseudooceanicola nanhaiensis]MCA0920856.1 GntR family transcriptional regulator [Pseudooceanicola nanhaiensis]
MQDLIGTAMSRGTSGLAESFGLSDTGAGLFEGGPAGRTVYEVLRTRIVRLDLPPGTSLPRAELAKTFGVSLTPLRDALQQLAEEGLVRIFPQSKTLVAPIDVPQVREAQFLRLALETEVVRQLASEGISDADLARLRSIHALQESLAGDAAAVPTFQELDELFHQALFAAAGHEQSQRVMRSRAGHLDRLRRIFLPDDGTPTDTGPVRMDAVLGGHADILDGIAARDVSAATTALRAHLQRTVDRITEKRAAYPEYFG